MALTLGNLGSVRRDLGDPAGALEAQERALDVFERAYGFGHPKVAATLLKLSYCFDQLGEKALVQSSRKLALAIFEAKLGPDHPDTRMARDALKRMEDGA